MKLIAQKNNWILQNVVIMKINNCLTRANHFSTHHQSSSNVILLWQNKCRINWSLDLPFNWFILSPKELILTAITRTVNHNDVSKNFLRRFIFFYCETILKVHSSFICFCCYFHLLHDFIVTDKLLFFQFIYFDDAIPAAFYIDMICTSFFCLIFMC